MNSHVRAQKWNRKPNPDRLNKLIGFVETSNHPITAKNYEVWLPAVAYINDLSAACPAGRDHPCNNGLGEWLGIEPYGQGSPYHPLPWNEQQGYSADRLNIAANPLWIAALLAAPFPTQKRMVVDMLTTLRDTGEFVYDYHAFNFGQDLPVQAHQIV